MSLLLDALKKSEAQRRRGTTPTIDLTRTPPSGSPRRPGARWLLVLSTCVLLVAAAPWLWPPLSDWIEARQDGSDEVAALAENAAASAAGSESESRSEEQTGVRTKQMDPAPVAGAASPRRVAAVDSGLAGRPDETATPERTSGDSQKASGDSRGSPAAIVSNTDDGAGPDNAPAEPKEAVAASDSEAGASMQELRRVVQARKQQQQGRASAPPEPPAKASRPVNEASANFIRPWELPQVKRAEFPELKLTVHFYAERAADRFVLINGERYREGQRVGPETMLAEIRQRGAVVEFGTYRVLIE